MYLKWDQKTISDFSDQNLDNLYQNGFLFTRLGHGVMDKTRSLRIDLSKFELSSENRRILRKTENIIIEKFQLPYQDYDWRIGKLGKDFYNTKFGEKTFSANKIKELITLKNNFNLLFVYKALEEKIGFCISFETKNILHYCYPFYNLNDKTPNIGLGMMLKAIVWAKESGKKYVYLGSAQRKTDIYKLQFEGVEWFDNNKWNPSQTELKDILTSL